mmetsp:Transcript_16825/g.50493  ORF Transcript_16825/g.50493 Transcript_16825/m.50493 type:complete len:388 (+) Transcript_16825:187-1350(+)
MRPFARTRVTRSHDGVVLVRAQGSLSHNDHSARTRVTQGRESDRSGMASRESAHGITLCCFFPCSAAQASGGTTGGTTGRISCAFSATSSGTIDVADARGMLGRQWRPRADLRVQAARLCFGQRVRHLLSDPARFKQRLRHRAHLLLGLGQLLPQCRAAVGPTRGATGARLCHQCRARLLLRRAEVQHATLALLAGRAQPREDPPVELGDRHVGDQLGSDAELERQAVLVPSSSPSSPSSPPSAPVPIQMVRSPSSHLVMSAALASTDLLSSSSPIAHSSSPSGPSISSPSEITPFTRGPARAGSRARAANRRRRPRRRPRARGSATRPSRRRTTPRGTRCRRAASGERACRPPRSASSAGSSARTTCAARRSARRPEMPSPAPPPC